MFGDDLGGKDTKGKAKKAEGEARVKRPDRRQSVFRPQTFDELIPPDHRARGIVKFVDEMDLESFYAPIKSRGSDPGRPATDPAMLIALWLFATSEGVGSARHLERLCERDDAYRWICGGVQVNQHGLSDFRVDHGAALDDLLTQVLGVLMHQGLVVLKRVAQDGVRVRANAGAASFRRQPRLRECLREAKEQVRLAKAMLDKEDPTRSDKQRESAHRAAREREDRVKKAMEELRELQATKTDEDAKEARASTTDPESRVMRMADGGYRPAFNMQFAVDTDTRAIVGIGVTNSGSDMGQIEPMLEEVERRLDKKPKEWLVDGGYTSLADIEAVGEKGVKVFAPLQQPRSPDIDPHQPKKNDTEHVAEWRKRMGTGKAKDIYKDRASTSERTNADLRQHRGLRHLPVRGIEKTMMVGLWMAITYNALLWIGQNAATL
ncbi:MAG: IS1182 family transposase [Planctomycetes bacterium]|nr:IS1182 family transposase [Planctomycetota bacterium]MBX3461918.1 IS1182 family transposase [Planctomycetota bacterium]